MKEIKRYTDFSDSILEGSNLKKELFKLGYNKHNLIDIFSRVQRGELGHFLHSEGKALTFGILNAIYKDAIELHRSHEIKKGSIKALVRLIPMALSPISLLVSYIGMAFGSSRAANKILKPILDDPGSSYPEFLKRLVSMSMKVVEGEISGDDPIKTAFVVSDGLVDMLKDEIVVEFTIFLSDKMSQENPDTIVPEYYIENEFRTYLNQAFKLNPELPLKKEI